MKFENQPQLFLTKDEFDTLNKAMKLCQDMDNQLPECEMCPFQYNCSHVCGDCIYEVARDMLKKIIDIAIIK